MHRSGRASSERLGRGTRHFTGLMTYTTPTSGWVDSPWVYREYSSPIEGSGPCNHPTHQFLISWKLSYPGTTLSSSSSLLEWDLGCLFVPAGCSYLAYKSWIILDLPPPGLICEPYLRHHSFSQDNLANGYSNVTRVLNTAHRVAVDSRKTPERDFACEMAQNSISSQKKLMNFSTSPNLSSESPNFIGVVNHSTSTINNPTGVGNLATENGKRTSNFPTPRMAQWVQAMLLNWASFG